MHEKARKGTERRFIGNKLNKCQNFYYKSRDMKRCKLHVRVGVHTGTVYECIRK